MQLQVVAYRCLLLHAAACRCVPLRAHACRCVSFVCLQDLLRAANIPVVEKQLTVALGRIHNFCILADGQ